MIATAAPSTTISETSPRFYETLRIRDFPSIMEFEVCGPSL